jgi:hypothetical protein
MPCGATLDEAFKRRENSTVLIEMRVGAAGVSMKRFGCLPEALFQPPRAGTCTSADRRLCNASADDAALLDHHRIASPVNRVDSAGTAAPFAELDRMKSTISSGFITYIIDVQRIYTGHGRGTRNIGDRIGQEAQQSSQV